MATTALVASLVALVWRAFIDIQPDGGSTREWAFKSPTEDLRVASVNGRWFRAAQARGIVCLLHNWGASRNRYYAVADDLAQRGYHVFVFDLPGHGARSIAHPFWIFGLMPSLVREVCDLTAALPGALNVLELPVHLLGYSLGSGVALEVYKLSPQVKSLICDSGPFSLSHRAIGMLVDRNLPNSPRWYRSFTRTWFFLAVNLPKRYQVLKNLALCQGRPAMIIENTRETFIPLDELHEFIARWPGPKIHWRVERAQHLMAYAVNRDDYINRVVDFLQGSP